MSENITRIVDLPDNMSQDIGSIDILRRGSDTSHLRPLANMSQDSSAMMRRGDQPPNISMQIMPPSTNTRSDYDPQNPTYAPINIHPNPYGNSIEPNVMPLPQQKYQAPQQQQQHAMTNDAMAELRNMEPMRLPSRDIPMDQSQYQQDEEIKPNYIPKPKLTKDYIREYEEAAEKSARKHEKSKRQAEQIEDAMVDFQLPVLVALLFFIFQIPIVHTIMYKYLSALPIFHSDGNLNFYGILLKSVMFGSTFWGLQSLIHFVS